MKAFGRLMMTLVLGALIAAPVFGQTRDPVGESADYVVDRNSSRTTSMIQSGNMTARVDRFIPDHPDGPSYEMVIDYVFKIQFMGTQRGTEVRPLPEVYFTEQFLADLRANGEYISDSFKVQHLGFGDARTMDGNFYPNCDKIRIYDIDTETDNQLVRIARSMLSTGSPGTQNDIEDLEIQGHIFQGVPVLGAVKLDVSGLYQGMRVKAGADYTAP